MRINVYLADTSTKHKRVYPRQNTLACASCLYFLTACAFGLLLKPCSAQETKQKRNVLLVMTDDCNCDLGCYGHELVKTPNIDRLAQRGIRFEKAYSQYPVCNPSRSSMMTGLFPDQTGVLSNAIFFRDKLPDVVTLPQMFRNEGYWVGRVGKIYHYNVPMQIGESGMDDPASWETTVNPRGIDREVHDQIHTLQKGKFGGTLSWMNLESKPEDCLLYTSDAADE